ncbi:MAG: hypothetical protein RLY16_145 [Bacteroidota bacterium]
MAAKKELRATYRLQRAALSEQTIARWDDLMLIQFQQAGIAIGEWILTYAAMAQMQEFDPIWVTDYCKFQQPQCKLAYPVIDEKTTSNEMQCKYASDETEFVLNRYKIAEPISDIIVSPQDLDMVIVPLLCFDQNGFRVGYGKGYYDRLLAQCRSNCLFIGFSYFAPVEKIKDVNQWDIPLHLVITPEKTYRF